MYGIKKNHWNVYIASDLVLYTCVIVRDLLLVRCNSIWRQSVENTRDHLKTTVTIQKSSKFTKCRKCIDSVAHFKKVSQKATFAIDSVSPVYPSVKPGFTFSSLFISILLRTYE